MYIYIYVCVCVFVLGGDFGDCKFSSFVGLGCSKGCSFWSRVLARGVDCSASMLSSP